MSKSRYRELLPKSCIATGRSSFAGRIHRHYAMARSVRAHSFLSTIRLSSQAGGSVSNVRLFFIYLELGGYLRYRLLGQLLDNRRPYPIPIIWYRQRYAAKFYG